LSRLVCPCGRNIADLVLGPDGSSVEVRHRVEVTQHPLPIMGHPSPTYTWGCRCGRPHRRRHERLVAAYLGAAAGRVDYLILDRDV
jgi:hypothetical protein